MQVNSPDDFLYNLQAYTQTEAKRLWRKHIKEKWNHECAYCGSTENLTLDHIVPQMRGGNNHITNVLCSCASCNGAKSHSDWLDWYQQQEFYKIEREQKIIDWITSNQKTTGRYPYGGRKNDAINYQVKIA